MRGSPRNAARSSGAAARAASGAAARAASGAAARRAAAGAAALVSSLVLFAASPAVASPAPAARPGAGTASPTGSATVPTGNDISFPQCGGQYPVGQAFGIVGVNNGRPPGLNPCLGPDPTTSSYTTSELYWAVASSTGATAQPRASLYVNTADPGDVYAGSPITDWPTSGTTPAGICTTTAVKTSTGTQTLGANTPACAWQYGHNKAVQDAAWLTTTAAAINAETPPVSVPSSVGSYPWWLDVETTNTWLTGTNGLAMNAAVLEGIVSGLEQAGASAPGEVGVYSTTTQWNDITGGSPLPSSSLYGLPTWLPGAGSLSGAAANCAQPSFTGGVVQLTQWVGTTYDSDYSCVAPGTGPTPTPTPTPAPGSSLPVVSYVSPSSGPVTGGTTVTVVGTGLLGATSVEFGLSAATSYSVDSATEITATSPAEPAGPVYVAVTTAAGTSVATAADQFTYLAPGVPATSGYYPLTPSRICDTRPGNPSGLSGTALSNCENKAPGPGTSLDVEVAGLGGVPAGASAVALDVVAVDPSASGYLTVFPTGAAPPTASSMNFVANSPPKANLVIVALPASGDVSIFNSAGTTQVVVDVEGYVAPVTTTGQGSTVTFDPARICDTRAGQPSNPCTGQAPKSGGAFDVPILGRASIPSSGVEAVVVTITAIDPSAPGYLTAFPAGGTMPTSSVVNYSTGVTVANSAIIPVGANGDIAIYASAGGPNIAIDAVGYVTGPDSSASSQLATTPTPVRICDTRPGNPSGLSGTPLSQCEGRALGPNGSLSIEVTGLGGVPQGATAVVVNLTVTNTTSASYLSAYGAGTAWPGTSDLNWLAGMTTSDLAVVPLGANGDITLYNYAGSTDVVVDVLGYIAPTPAA